MIKCQNSDKSQLLSFLKKNPSENGFVIGDLENFDLNEDFIDVWKIECDRKISSVLLRYYKYYLASTDQENDLSEIADTIGREDKTIFLSGAERIALPLSEMLGMGFQKKTYLAELTSETMKPLSSSIQPIRATGDNIDELFEFQKSIEEFSLDDSQRESFGKEVLTDTGAIYYIRENGRIVSSATLTAVNSVNGTIIGVATDKEFRQRGYAKATMLAICQEMAKKEKTVVLFYNNPDAGKLYKSIGFVDVGRWAMGKYGE